MSNSEDQIVLLFYSAGMKYTIDLNREPYKRITQIALSHPDEPGFITPDDDTLVRVLTNDYIGAGRDGFDMFGKDKTQNYMTGPLDVDVIKAYFQKMSPVSQKVGERIKIIPYNPATAKDDQPNKSCSFQQSIVALLITALPFMIS